jgi:NADPH:quinone reductase-like Zn-dependent oxidoreductase
VDLVLDYSKQDVAKEVLAFTQGRGADLVWDSTYLLSSLQQSAGLVAKGGLWCMLGTAEQLVHRGITDFDALLQPARQRGATSTFSDFGRRLHPGVEGEPTIRADILNAAIKYWDEGSVKPRITLELPFDAAALQQTFDDWKDKGVGKVVVKCSSP